MILVFVFGTKWVFDAHNVYFLQYLEGGRPAPFTVLHAYFHGPMLLPPSFSRPPAIRPLLSVSQITQFF